MSFCIDRVDYSLRNDRGAVRAYCSYSINGVVVLHGSTICEDSETGNIFLSAPKQKDVSGNTVFTKSGSHPRTYYHPTSYEATEYIRSVILSGYQRLVSSLPENHSLYGTIVKVPNSVTFDDWKQEQCLQNSSGTPPQQD